MPETMLTKEEQEWFVREFGTPMAEIDLRTLDKDQLMAMVNLRGRTLKTILGDAINLTRKPAGKLKDVQYFTDTVQVALAILDKAEHFAVEEAAKGRH